MKNSVISASAILLFFFSAAMPSAVHAQMSMRQMERAQNDMHLYEQMSKVSTWLSQFCEWNHRFPEPGDQTSDAKKQLNQLVPNIPYQTGLAQLASGLDADPQYADTQNSPSDSPQPMPVAASMDRINLVITTMTDADVEQYLIQPPSDWTAPPGTITALSNQANMFVIWGAGENGLPIRDPDTGRVKLLVGHYNLLNDTQE